MSYPKDEKYRHEDMYKKEMEQQAKDYMSPFPADYTKHFSVKKRIELFVQDLGNKINPAILIPRFQHLIADIQRGVVEIDIDRMKLERSWYGIEERIWRFRETVDIQRRFDFDALIYDIRKGAVAEAISGSYSYLPTFSITKKTTMRTEDELKNEIDELTNIQNDISTEIEVMNAKNKNAQAQRDRVTAKIDGLRWMLNEGEEQDAPDS